MYPLSSCLEAYCSSPSVEIAPNSAECNPNESCSASVSGVCQWWCSFLVQLILTEVYSQRTETSLVVRPSRRWQSLCWNSTRFSPAFRSCRCLTPNRTAVQVCMKVKITMLATLTWTNTGLTCLVYRWSALTAVASRTNLCSRKHYCGRCLTNCGIYK